MNKIVNLRSAKYLVRRYEKFLKMEIPYGNFFHGLRTETGFSHKCILCKEVARKNVFVHCNLCIWSLAGEVLNLQELGCVNDNFHKIVDTKSYEEGKKLLTERIAMLKELIKKAENKKWKK